MYLTRSSVALWRYERCICAEALWSRPECLKHSSLSYKIFQNMHLQICNVLKIEVSMNGIGGEGQMLVCIDVCMHAVICGIPLGQWRAGARVYVGRLGIITWPRERARESVCMYVWSYRRWPQQTQTDTHVHTQPHRGASLKGCWLEHEQCGHCTTAANTRSTFLCFLHSRQLVLGWTELIVTEG